LEFAMCRTLLVHEPLRLRIRAEGVDCSDPDIASDLLLYKREVYVVYV
jgi:hypothetical protein